MDIFDCQADEKFPSRTLVSAVAFVTVVGVRVQGPAAE